MFVYLRKICNYFENNLHVSKKSSTFVRFLRNCAKIIKINL